VRAGGRGIERRRRVQQVKSRPPRKGLQTFVPTTPLCWDVVVEELLGYNNMRGCTLGGNFKFAKGRKSVILGVWAAPGPRRLFQKVEGFAPHLWEGPPGPPRPPKWPMPDPYDVKFTPKVQPGIGFGAIDVTIPYEFIWFAFHRGRPGGGAK
jgi:hypothetical protein